jgi:hypothetical protein
MGRHRCSRAPFCITRPVLSWTRGRKSSDTTDNIGPFKYIEVNGAVRWFLPNCLCTWISPMPSCPKLGLARRYSRQIIFLMLVAVILLSSSFTAVLSNCSP